jgi:hypothetical protein
MSAQRSTRRLVRLIDAVRFRARSLYTQGTWKMSHSGLAI